jgi:hypothetical protein
MSRQTETPAEASAWVSSRERVVISLRPIGAPTSIGIYGLIQGNLLEQVRKVPNEPGVRTKLRRPERRRR